VCDGRERAGGTAVPGELGPRPVRREAGNEWRRGHETRTERLEQLHHAVGHPIEVRHLVERRDLERERAAPHHRLQITVQLAPRAVGPDLPRKVRQRLELNPVGHGHRTAGAREEDEQPPGPHPRIAEDAGGDRIHLAEVVEQPAVGPKGGERLRQGGEIEAVEERHQRCLGSGGAPRHSHAAPPVARQET